MAAAYRASSSVHQVHQVPVPPHQTSREDQVAAIALHQSMATVELLHQQTLRTNVMGHTDRRGRRDLAMLENVEISSLVDSD